VVEVEVVVLFTDEEEVVVEELLTDEVDVEVVDEALVLDVLLLDLLDVVVTKVVLVLVLAFVEDDAVEVFVPVAVDAGNVPDGAP
jgi:hypothetical protein